MYNKWLQWETIWNCWFYIKIPINANPKVLLKLYLSFESYLVLQVVHKRTDFEISTFVKFKPFISQFCFYSISLNNAGFQLPFYFKCLSRCVANYSRPVDIFSVRSIAAYLFQYYRP